VAVPPPESSPAGLRSAWWEKHANSCAALTHPTFEGWKRSAFGDMKQRRPEGVRFCARVKTVTAHWPKGGVRENMGFVIPTMK
jgi:hypothetical protein